jgi:thiamine-phosphate pyrophosphorylase
MRQALAGGVRFFQYRSKSETRKSIYEQSLQLARIARAAGALFIVNDHADIAAAVDADGVHLGQDDLPCEYARKLLGNNKLIGISTHNAEQARTAEGIGADYIGFGPLFETATKDAGQMQGIENLSKVKRAVGIPVIAIGGINHANVQDVIRSGADGAAIISAILSAESIVSASERIVRSLSQVKGDNT